MIGKLPLLLILFLAAPSFALDNCASTDFLIKAISKATTAIYPTAKTNAETSVAIIDQMVGTLNSSGLKGKSKSTERKRRLINLNEMSKAALNSNTSFLNQYVSSKDCDVVARWKSELERVDDLINQDTKESREQLKHQLIETRKSITDGVAT